MCALGVPCGAQEVLDPRLSPYPNNPCNGMLPPPDASNAIQSGYFFNHHTSADTIDRMDPHQLNFVTASLAVWAVSIANLPELLPRSGDVPPMPAPPGDNNAPGKAAAVAGSISAVVLAGGVAFFMYRRRVAARAGAGGGGPTQGAAYASMLPTAQY